MSQEDTEIVTIRADGSGDETPKSLGTIAVDMDDVLWCVTSLD